MVNGYAPAPVGAEWVAATATTVLSKSWHSVFAVGLWLLGCIALILYLTCSVVAPTTTNGSKQRAAIGVELAWAAVTALLCGGASLLAMTTLGISI